MLDLRSELIEPIDDVTGYRRTETGLWVPERRRQKYSRPTCVDLFCGAGGFSLGMIASSFQVVMGVDNWPAAAMTYLYNLGSYPLDMRFTSQKWREVFKKALERHEKKVRKEDGVYVPFVSGGNFRDWTLPYVKGPTEGDDSVPWATWQLTEEQWRDRATEARHQGIPAALPVPHFYFGDVRELTGKMILNAIGLEIGELDCVVGAPPCQGFSMAGKRNVMDPCNSLVFEFARLVIEMKPKTMVMENVPGIVSMTTPEGLPIVDAFCRVLEDGGFGTYEALKRSLVATSGAGAVLRGKKKDQRKKKKNREMEKQKELFA